jgi:hypothetical protein
MGEEGPRFTLGCPIDDGRNKMNDLDMTAEELKKTWKDEEDCAFIKGWDFSHIHGRYEEEDSLPWDYEEIIRSVLKDEMKLLDYDTGAVSSFLNLIIPIKTRLQQRDTRRMLCFVRSVCHRLEST